MIIYPDKPWVDGQTFVHTTGEGIDITGLYNEPTNSWTFYKGTGLDVVYTNNVYTLDIKPALQQLQSARALFDAAQEPEPGALVTQQDVNWFLYDVIARAEANYIWVGDDMPPQNDLGEYLFMFWWKITDQEMWYYNAGETEWQKSGFLEFDRPPVISETEPTEHPKFPGKDFDDGDFWYEPITKSLHIWDKGAFNLVAPFDELEGPVRDLEYNYALLKAALDLVYTDTQQNLVKKEGDRMYGSLKMSNQDDETQTSINTNGTISFQSEALNGRASGALLVNNDEQDPIVVSSGSSYLPTFGVAGYKEDELGKRRINFTVDAAGRAYTLFANVNSDKQLVNKEWVDGELEPINEALQDIEEEQIEQDSAIEELENKVNALEGSVVDGRWEYDTSASARTGDFILKKVDGSSVNTFNDTDTIQLSTTDNAGKTFTFERPLVNDVIRVGGDIGSSAEYQISQVMSPGVYKVNVLSATGSPVVGTVYDFLFLTTFDPAGLATIDYVDAQDNTRVKKSGDTLTGPLNFTTQSSILEISGDTGSVLRRYIKVRGNNQFEILGYPGQDNSGSRTCFKLEQKAGDTPKLTLNYIEDPTANGHAVNLRYANNNYLKLSGGTLTGNINLDNKSVFWKDSDGNEVAKITNTGFVKTTDMFRADRTADANTFESRRNGTTNAYIKSTGFASFKGSQFNGSMDITTSGNGMRVLGDFKVKKSNQGLTGTNSFEVSGSSIKAYTSLLMNDNRIQNVANANNDTDALNRRYADGRYTRGAYTISKSGGNFYIS